MPYAPLRIWKSAPVVVSKSGMERATTASDIKETPYYERLIKLIPAEIISIYMIGKGVIPNTQASSGETASWIWAGVCLLLLLFFRIKASSSSGKLADAQWPSVFISSISYLIWLYNMGGILDSMSFYEHYKYIGALAILVWTFLVPYFYKGEEPAAGQ